MNEVKLTWYQYQELLKIINERWPLGGETLRRLPPIFPFPKKGERRKAELPFSLMSPPTFAEIERDKPITIIIVEFEIKFSPEPHWQPVTKINFIDIFEFYEKNTSATISPGTVRNYNNAITQIKKYQAKLTTKDITLSWLKAWQAAMISDGLEIGTQALYYSVLRLVCNAAGHGEPFKTFKINFPKGKKITYLTVDEIELCFQELQKPEYTLIQKSTMAHFVMACHTGARYSDWIGYRIEGDNFTYTSQKTKTEILFAIDDVPGLRRVLNYIQDNKFTFIGGSSAANRIVERLQKACNIEKFDNEGNPVKLTPHDAKHTCVTLLANMGKSSRQISAFVGTTPDVIDSNYAHINNKEIVKNMFKK